MPTARSSSPPLLEFHNVSVIRGTRVALDSVTLSIDAGEHVAILGPNGSGKSTLIKAITRECYPRHEASGSWLRILGEDHWDIFALRSLLGIVTNDLMQTCTRDLTGREVILSGFFSSIGIWPHQVITAAMERKTEEILELLEIQHLADRSMTEMSSGEARRVLIGRALVHDPKALVLDEPANSLDLHASHELRVSLRKLALAGTSIILVTHQLSDIIPEITRVIFIKDGRVYLDGPKDRVLTEESLRDLFDTPVELARRDGYYHLW